MIGIFSLRLKNTMSLLNYLHIAQKSLQGNKDSKTIQ